MQHTEVAHGRGHHRHIANQLEPESQRVRERDLNGRAVWVGGWVAWLLPLTCVEHLSCGRRSSNALSCCRLSEPCEGSDSATNDWRVDGKACIVGLPQATHTEQTHTHTTDEWEVFTDSGGW